MTLKIHVPTFYKRSALPKAEGKRKMALSVTRAGQPDDNTKPPVMPDFVQRKIKASTRREN
jgi:hypothetical protein